MSDLNLGRRRDLSVPAMQPAFDGHLGTAQIFILRSTVYSHCQYRESHDEGRRRDHAYTYSRHRCQAVVLSVFTGRIEQSSAGTSKLSGRTEEENIDDALVTELCVIPFALARIASAAGSTDR